MCSPKILSKITASRAKHEQPSSLALSLPLPLIGSASSTPQVSSSSSSHQAMALHSAVQQNYQEQKLQHNGIVDLLIQEGQFLDQARTEFKRKIKALQVYSKLQQLQTTSIVPTKQARLIGSSELQGPIMIQRSFSTLVDDHSSSDRLSVPSCLHGASSFSASPLKKPSGASIPLPERFPKRLYRMLIEVEQQGKGHIVSFNRSGTGFQIHDAFRFEKEVLPLYFSHGKIGSFKRQLNLYGFRRVTKGEDAGSHAHEVFHRSNRAQSERIKRVK